VFRSNPFQSHSLQYSYHPTQSVSVPQPTAQLPSNTIRSSPTSYSTVTIQHNPFQPHSLSTVTIQHNLFQTHSLQHIYHPTQFVPGPQPTAQLPSNTIRSRPTTYNTVTIQHNPFQTHSLQHSYHPTQPFKLEKYNTKSKI
jgi:hypothetical protein